MRQIDNGVMDLFPGLHGDALYRAIRKDGPVHVEGEIWDLFAGGGGASQAIFQATGRHPTGAANHDKEACALHRANHPDTRHYEQDIWEIDPLKVTKRGAVGLLWASPDCKHFSKAKGGKPVSKKIRSLAWVVTRWAKAVKPTVIAMENVEEFKTWGPVLADGQPCKRRKGKTFRAFKRTIERLGYAVDHTELRACDYGAPTIRKRLFLVARCDGQPITWPEPTHGPGRPLPWRIAAECVDFSLPCPSIFLTKEEAKAAGCKRPLAEKTERRIANGLKKFVLDRANPFIVSLTHAGGDRLESLEEPLRTVTGAKRGEKALVMPILTEHANGSSPRSFPIDEPLRTQMAETKGGHFAAVEAIVTPYLAGVGGRAGQSPERPGSALDEPLSTVTSSDHNSLCTSSLLKLRGTSNHGQPMDEPAATISAQGNHLAEVRAFFVKFFGNETDGAPLDEPMHTVTARDRFGLITIHGELYEIADIGMRMLVPRELYLAQGFPPSYIIERGLFLLEDGVSTEWRPLTKTAQVRMCGNSVSPEPAEALLRAQFPLVAPLKAAA